jgi:hypothetical protein
MATGAKRPDTGSWSPLRRSFGGCCLDNDEVAERGIDCPHAGCASFAADAEKNDLSGRRGRGRG